MEDICNSFTFSPRLPNQAPRPVEPATTPTGQSPCSRLTDVHSVSVRLRRGYINHQIPQAALPEFAFPRSPIFDIKTPSRLGN